MNRGTVSRQRGWYHRLFALGLLLSSCLVAAETATLNFKNADINVVIETVAGITGKNFVIDPRVKGKVTVISSHSMEAKEIYQVFLAMLEVHGFAAVPGGGNALQIVPTANAKQAAIETLTNERTKATSDLITRVIQVENVSAAQLVPILRPLIPQHGHLAAYQSTNTLIISDRADNVARIEKIIRGIDQPSGSEIEVVRLKQASVSEVIRILSAMEKGGPKDKSDDAFVADERTNSILLAGSKDWRNRIKNLISHLDFPIDGDSGNTHVIYLRYAKADELVKVLTGVAKAEGKGRGGKGKPPAPAGVSGDLQIQADEGTNALVITAPPEQLRTLQGVVKKLDIPRAQVMVEAIIAEISDDKTREFGMQWLFDGTANGGSGPIVATNFSAGTSLSNFAAGIQNGTPIVGDGINAVVGGGGNFAGLVRALSGESGVNVLSTPSLVTLDNEEAEIVVGENRPFVSGSYSGAGGSATPTNPFTTVQRQDVGLSLKVSPQINEGSAILLTIEQEVSSVIPGTEGDSNGPSTTKRSIKTSVMVEDGKVLVLGGLIDDQVQEVEQRVPLLGSIPILGWLFRYSKVQKIKRNLMVFLKPTILQDSHQATLVSSEKYNYMRLREFAAREEMSSLLSNREAPLLKELDQLMSLPSPYLLKEREMNGLPSQPQPTKDEGANIPSPTTEFSDEFESNAD